jgi:hypothetical protein
VNTGFQDILGRIPRTLDLRLSASQKEFKYMNCSLTDLFNCSLTDLSLNVDRKTTCILFNPEHYRTISKFKKKRWGGEKILTLV